MTRYRLIVADPPWRPTLHANNPARWVQRRGGPQKHYRTLTVDDIESLVPPSADKCHLYLWAISQHIDWGYRVARAWGFEPQQTLTWCKPGFGIGRFQCNTEHLIVARKGSPVGQPFGPSGGTRFTWSRGRHSEKPAEAFALIERMSPFSPRLEMFARRERDGWDVFGDEVATGVALHATAAR